MTYRAKKKFKKKLNHKKYFYKKYFHVYELIVSSCPYTLRQLDIVNTDWGLN